MADHNTYPEGVPYTPESEDEERLWQDLAALEAEQPPASLRRSFYQRLRRMDAPSWFERLTQSLRFAAPATAVLLLGILIGTQLPRGPGADVEALNAQVASLNQTVALMLMQDSSASERLRGVSLASQLQAENGRLVSALLATAAGDPVSGVRNAAVEALGPHLDDPKVSSEIQRMLVDTDSVLVQTALAELLMRWGDDDQIMRLIEAAEQDQLMPEVSRYVLDRVRRISA